MTILPHKQLDQLRGPSSDSPQKVVTAPKGFIYPHEALKRLVDASRRCE